MNWKNLKNNKCPNCGKDVVTHPFNYTPYNMMLEHKCGFKITTQRYKEIVSGMVDRELEEQRKEHDGANIQN